MTTVSPFSLPWRESEYAGTIGDFQTHNLTELEQIGLCETCSTISWAGFVSPSAIMRRRRPAINHTIEVLEKSACRICRFLAMVISSHDSEVFPSAPPYRLKLTKKISLGDRGIGIIGIKEAKMFPISPLPTDTHVLAIQDKCPSIFQPLDSVMIGGMPLELLKNAINTCEKKHGHHCTTENPDRLRNLKVIDCKRGKVVSAPAACRYVALSYVWGPKKASLGAENTFKASQLPKTVRDSCSVAQSLGYRYLWVDRYVSRCYKQSLQIDSCDTVHRSSKA
jgi:hypothetical protein